MTDFTTTLMAQFGISAEAASWSIANGCIMSRDMEDDDMAREAYDEAVDTYNAAFLIAHPDYVPAW